LVSSYSSVIPREENVIRFLWIKHLMNYFDLKKLKQNEIRYMNQLLTIGWIMWL